MKSEKTKDQAQSGTEQSKIPAPDLAQQIYPTATVGRGANQPTDPSAAMTIDKTTIEETEKAATAKREQKDWNKRIRLCKYWSIILGLCVVLVMIVLPFCLPASADLGVMAGIMFSLAALYYLIILVAIIIAGVTMESSFRRKKHALKDYLIVGIGVIMMLSPLIYFYSVSIIRHIGWSQ